MPELDLQTFANTPPADLEQMRRNLIAKASGNHENLSLDDLHMLAGITAVLRRRASGPPKEPKKAAGTRAKPSKATVEDLA